jgi:hypothetical protein
MRHPDQQTHDEHPEVIRSEPVPVPAATDDDAGAGQDRATGQQHDRGYDDPGDEPHDDTDPQDTHDDTEPEDTHGDTGPEDTHDDTERKDSHDDTGPEDALDDRGSYDADRTADDPDADLAADADGTDDPDADRADDDPDRAADVPGPDSFTAQERAALSDLDDSDQTTFHEPAAQPTAFGAATVGGAAAAAAMANDVRASEHEVRDEDPDRSADGATDDQTAPIGRPDDRDTDTSDGPAEMLPGEVPEPATTLFAQDAARGFQERWRDVQLRFVDDPHAAAGEAQQLVEEAVDSLTAALAAQRQDLGGWQDGGSDDTERLRVVVRRYRDFLDRLLAI